MKIEELKLDHPRKCVSRLFTVKEWIHYDRFGSEFKSQKSCTLGTPPKMTKTLGKNAKIEILQIKSKVVEN